MAAKIRDVARLAGVSPGTVSRVLHNKGYISRDTRKKVSEAIAKLSYHPNTVASRLVSGKTHCIGLLVPNLHEFYYVEITEAIVEEMKTSGYTLLVTTSNGDKSHLNAFLQQGNMDGLLVITPYYLGEELSLIAQQEIPCVLINYAPENHEFSSIYCDQFQVGYSAIRYLIDLGHTTIGFCTSDTHSPSPMKRLQGCLQALSDAKLGVKGSHLRDMSSKLSKNPVAEMQRWIQEDDLPTALFVFSDDLALYVMDALKDAGYRIPQDISVLGCGNMQLAERTIPSLTTVDQHTSELGSQAVAMIMRYLQSGRPLEHEVQKIVPRLVERKSCGPRM